MYSDIPKFFNGLNSSSIFGRLGILKIKWTEYQRKRRSHFITRHSLKFKDLSQYFGFTHSLL